MQYIRQKEPQLATAFTHGAHPPVFAIQESRREVLAILKSPQSNEIHILSECYELFLNGSHSENTNCTFQSRRIRHLRLMRSVNTRARCAGALRRLAPAALIKRARSQVSRLPDASAVRLPSGSTRLFRRV